ncbi:polysaccharide biosynthesis tyrosine autokinase [Fulvivirgaceae bacterium PWU4]|uniref:non-specific protein-tyrosine kinase n=1 Tax=Chryseosolibacter histidini TaxID=2782349 RepID=A0AAP2DTL0_9BACT|nr:tyrosine-protein kinase [Chryseosolibacter histidini]MBT1700334.1 polysaccharide biosynthesis tyrosine autokinase [Chryseosolibacter histidini]
MDEKIDIKHLVRKITNHWWYFLVAVTLLVPLAYLYIKTADEIYSVKASLLIANQEQTAPNTEKFMKGMELLTSYTEIEDEVGVLGSHTMVKDVIRQLDFGVSYFEKQRFKNVEMYEDIPFTVTLDSSKVQMINVPIFVERISPDTFRIRAEAQEVSMYDLMLDQIEREVSVVDFDEVALATDTFRNRYLGLKITFNTDFSKSDEKQYYFVINDLKSLVDAYQANLKIEPLSRESNILQLHTKGKVPAKEIVFLDALVNVYLKNQLDKKNQLGLKTIQFIDRQIGGVYDSLKQVEGSLETFRIRNNILDINATAQNLTVNLDRLEAEKAEVEVKLKYYTYVASSLNSNGDVKDIVAPSTFGLDDPLLSSLLIELSRLSQERTGLNYSTKENNPMSEVSDLKIRNTKKNLLENVNNIIDASTMALNDINTRLLVVKNRLNRLPKNERELVNLERRFKFNDNVYNYLLQKRAEAGIAIASNSPETTVIDRAKQVGYGPISPNKKIVFAIALFASLILPICLIVIKDFFNDNIISHEDIERSTKIPFIGTISRGQKREQNGIVAYSRTPMGESFRSLRVNLQYLTFGKDIQVIGFTSSGESEGKTFCAVNLAASMAQSGRRTILIDTDLRCPTVAGYFKLKNEKGLSTYLVGSAVINDIINKTEIKDLDVITSGPLPPNPLDLISHSRMATLIHTLKQSYHTIVMDAPPIGYVSEYVILMKYTDVNIYVVRSDYTSRFHLVKINKLYEEKKINNISILLNDVKPTKLNGYINGYMKKMKAKA